MKDYEANETADSWVASAMSGIFGEKVLSSEYDYSYQREGSDLHIAIKSNPLEGISGKLLRLLDFVFDAQDVILRTGISSEGKMETMLVVKEAVFGPLVTNGVLVREWSFQKLVCDGNCAKAWGFCARPRKIFDEENEDDFVFLGDHDLGQAPEDPGTGEGGHYKPKMVYQRLNKWCARQCERSVMLGRREEIILPDMTNPQPNCR
jgi:hypothetical protein